MKDSAKQGGSIAFDRAAEYYDRTRGLPPEAVRQVTQLLAGELRGRALEIGVGTGRIALPLAAAGAEVVGIDLSVPMLLKLRENSGGRAPFPVAVADATSLPFPDRCFGSGLAAHVFHLIPGWRAAAAELVRVVVPGGVVLVDPGGRGDAEWEEVPRRFIGELGTGRVGAADANDVDSAMAELGLRARELPAIAAHETTSLGAIIDEYEAGLYSATWSSTPAERSRAATVVRAWARSSLGSLDEQRPIEWAIRWRAYDVPEA